LDADFLAAFFAFRSNFLNPLLGAALPAVFLATFLGAGFLDQAGDFFLANFFLIAFLTTWNSSETVSTILSLPSIIWWLMLLMISPAC
jgi:hypothetical protein